MGNLLKSCPAPQGATLRITRGKVDDAHGGRHRRHHQHPADPSQVAGVRRPGGDRLPGNIALKLLEQVLLVGKALLDHVTDRDQPHYALAVNHR